MKTQNQIYHELLKEYMPDGLEGLVNTSSDARQAYSDYLILDLLADIDSQTIYWAQFAQEAVKGSE